MKSPKVTLVMNTPEAAALLVFAKQTRLGISPGRLTECCLMEEADVIEQLQEAARTIPSCWEFLDVCFCIENVTRACAQQITRTRTGSYAMQSMRVVNMQEAPVLNPFPEGTPEEEEFDEAITCVADCYSELVSDLGAPLEDARGILPLNTQTNLLAKYNFRAFVELVRSRSSLRTQSEYAEIVRQMKAAVLDTWPWASLFFQEKNEKALAMLEEVVEKMEMTTGHGTAWEISKAMDLLRGA